eukprot:908617-Pyramimonas_sp.AAC.1
MLPDDATRYTVLLGWMVGSMVWRLGAMVWMSGAMQSESRFKRPVDQSSATKGRSSIAGEGLNSPARA